MASTQAKKRAPRNRTLTLTNEDRSRLIKLLKRTPAERISGSQLEGIYQGGYSSFLEFIPEKSVDLLILDPPYNLDKSFNGRNFSKVSVDEYTNWLDGILKSLKPLLKSSASVYLCGEWYTSTSIFLAASNHFIVRNRITWEREKGRGAKTNWKNSSEDVWFCTVSNEYTFNVDEVKLRRKVLAPYTLPNGEPKDWKRTKEGNFRDTHPSNIWTDIVIPFWSMPENTDHPTQKSEKLIAKMILASSNENDLVLDPFSGSGTTAVVAKKLNRKYLCIEIEEEYCLWGLRRLEIADQEKDIQGFADGVFWERHTSSLINKQRRSAQEANSLKLF